jgi:hypothetical protein
MKGNKVSDTNEMSGISDLMQGLDEYMKNIRVEGDIEFPVEISAVKTTPVGKYPRAEKVGSWCSICPCSESKTYLGVYLGDLMLSAMHTYNVKDKVLTVLPHTNPAIFVPDLKRVVWGCESWWGIIESPDDLRKITDADIQNIWYMKALKELSAKDDESKPEC